MNTHFGNDNAQKGYLQVVLIGANLLSLGLLAAEFFMNACLWPKTQDLVPVRELDARLNGVIRAGILWS